MFGLDGRSSLFAAPQLRIPYLTLPQLGPWPRVFDRMSDVKTCKVSSTIISKRKRLWDAGWGARPKQVKWAVPWATPHPGNALSVVPLVKTAEDERIALVTQGYMEDLLVRGFKICDFRLKVIISTHEWQIDPYNVFMYFFGRYVEQFFKQKHFRNNQRE